MTMGIEAWERRLSEQLPGWLVWYAEYRGKPTHPWHAVPAAPDTPRPYWPIQPNRLNATIPVNLRELCRERYGWDDWCETCLVLARECGHRQPEREKG